MNSIYWQRSTAGTPRYASVARATADWVMRDMQSPEGGYYSTLDADSEHEEGKFYVWTPAQFDAALARDESSLAKQQCCFESGECGNHAASCSR